MAEYRRRPLGELVRCLDERRRPVRASDRRPGPYPYYGASGVVDHVDAFLFDGPHLLIAEDGENLRSRKTPIAFMAKGKFWVNNHAHIVVGNEQADTRFLAYAVQSADVSGYLTGSTQPKLTQQSLFRLPVIAPPLEEQRAIVDVLGPLDDKLESNRSLRLTVRALCHARIDETLRDNPWTSELSTLVRSMARGVAPRYMDDDPAAALVLNQRCVRDGWVEIASARHMRETTVAREKTAEPGDILVNSTGVGTLGRVALFHGPAAFVDGHVTVVKPDANKYAPTVLALVMIEAQPMIEELATGSTGQTELNRDRLGSLRLTLPTAEAAARLEEELAELESIGVTAQSEEQTLSELRDALLPELLSGRLRASRSEHDAEAAI